MIVSVVSCKKTTVTPTNNTAPDKPIITYTTYKKGKLTVNVQSNYKYPYIAIEQGSTTLKRINHKPTEFTTMAPLSYSQQLSSVGTYRVYVLVHNVAKYKSDTLALWYKAQVFLNDTIPLTATYEDNIQLNAKQCEFYFNIK